MIGYTLDVAHGTGHGAATLKVEGYMSDDEVQCDTTAQADSLVVSFNHAIRGDTATWTGGVPYHFGDVLLTLRWEGVRATRHLVTYWGGYIGEAPRSKEGLRQFDKVNNVSQSRR